MDLSSFFGGTMALTVLITLCTAIPFVAVAAFFFLGGRRSNRQAQASQAWPSVMGTVVASSV